MKRYSHIRNGYTPQPRTWHKVEDCHPAFTRLGYGRSEPVLLLQNMEMTVGYLERTDPVQWKFMNPGWYKSENVTHWRWLPNPPKGAS